MAHQTVYTASQRARAASLVETAQTWTRGTRKLDGLAFVLFPSSKPGHAYYTTCDGSACTCQGFFYRGACSHALACKMETEQSRERMTRRPTYDELMDDHLVDAF